MRVITGTARGIQLKTPEGLQTRPTSDRVKEAMFSIIQFDIPGARVLDLFAGSGSLGIESLSRGAKEVVFNDRAKESLSIVKRNLDALKIEIGKEAQLSNYDYAVCLDAQRQPFDIIFIDPPYPLKLGEKVLEKIAKNNLLTENGVAVYENDAPFDGEIQGLERYDERKYGKAYLTFFRKTN